MKKITVFVFSGPGGVGKTTLIEKLFKKKWAKEKLVRAISATTRGQRPGEKDGKDYLFISRQEFLRRKRKGYFLESEQVLENFYGTPRFFYDEAVKAKKSLILCIDVKGGSYLKNRLEGSKIITVFILAPNEKDLLTRLKCRNEDKEVIKKRIALAKQELKVAKAYDYRVVNHELEAALEEVEAIIRKETTQKQRRSTGDAT
jgi:guanylate kinase